MKSLQYFLEQFLWLLWNLFGKKLLEGVIEAPDGERADDNDWAKKLHYKIWVE